MLNQSGAPASQTTAESRQKAWTIVSWCHKVADSVSSKFEAESTAGKWLGRAVATVFVPFGIIPALVRDSIHGIKSLYDRCVERKETIDTKIPTKEEFAKLKTENEQLIVNCGGIHARAIKAESELSEALSECEKLRTEANNQRAMAKNAKREEANHKLEKEEVQSKLLKQLEDASEMLNKQQEKIEKQQAVLGEKDKNIHDMSSRLRSINSEIKVLKQNNDKLHSEKTELNEELSSLQNRLNDASIKASVAESKIGELNKQLEAEKGKSPKDKLLEGIFKDCENSTNDPDYQYKITIPSSEESEKRIVNLNDSQLTIVSDRLQGLEYEVGDLFKLLDEAISQAQGGASLTLSNPDLTDDDRQVNSESSVEKANSKTETKAEDVNKA